MFEATFDLSIKYKIPSLKIRYNRKLFCGLRKKRLEHTDVWFDRVHDQINRCEFAQFTEILLVDKFFCELSEDEIQPFLETDTWSLKQLNEYFSSRRSEESHVDERQQLPFQTVKNEITDRECIQNESSISLTDEENSSVDEIEIKKEETEVFIASHAPAAISVDDGNESTNEDFESSNEVFSDTTNCKAENITSADPLVLEQTTNNTTGRECDATRIAARKSLTCDLCTHLTFTHNYELLRHINIAHKGVNPFLCGLCGKGFAKRQLQKRHMIVHTKEKRFFCDICNKGFIHKISLNSHNKSVHQMSVSYDCDVCNKSFPKNAELRNHKKQAHNTPEVFYPCAYCSKVFKYQSGLKSHLISHEQVKPYSCGICNRKYSKFRNLYEHKQSAHPGAAL